jgi:hypothetical protein
LISKSGRNSVSTGTVPATLVMNGGPWAGGISSPPPPECLPTTSLYSDWLRAGWPICHSSSPGRGKIFLLSTSSRPVLGSTQPPVQWVPGTLSPSVKGPVPEADHSPPISVEVKNTWIYTSTPPYVFMAYELCSVRTGEI